MRRFPESIQNLVAAFTRLPGVGPKTALRYVYALLKLPKNELAIFAQQINQLAERVKVCATCRTYTEMETCDICLDERRDTSTLCVVEVARDISTIESTGAYHGRYFVLGGTLNPLEGHTPETLNVSALREYLTANAVGEIILAFSPDIHGETTMMYLTKELRNAAPKITRLARGLPTGAALEFADEVTLGAAIASRREI
jgi:recombination protein RecR